jgi:hypothetical protein
MTAKHYTHKQPFHPMNYVTSATSALPLFSGIADHAAHSAACPQPRQLRQLPPPYVVGGGGSADVSRRAGERQLAAYAPDKQAIPWNQQQLGRLLNCLSWQPASAASWILHRAAYYHTAHHWPLPSCNFQAALDWELARLARQLPDGTKPQRALAYFSLLEELL